MENLKCPACLSVKNKMFGNKNGYVLRQCESCSTIFSDVMIEKSSDARQVQEMYDNYYTEEDFAPLLAATAISLQNTVKSFEPFRQTKRFLDIGFGAGGILSVAQKNGWDCYGTEISPHSLRYGEAQGWQVSANPLADDNFPAGGFDVVTMIELIEHVPNPDEFLLTASQMLRDGGLLYVTTPNAASFNARFLGDQWSIFSPPEHINIWSLKGIKTAFDRAGLSVTAVNREGFNPTEMLLSLKKSEKVSISGPERNQAAFALNDAFTSSRPRLLVKKAINTGLSFFGIGDTLKIRAVRRIRES